MTEAIERTLELDASPTEVWRALTDPTELAGWFGDTAELSSTVGSEGWFGWKGHGKFAVRVEEFEPIKKFAWRWSHEAGAPLDEAPSTLVEWTLTPREDGGTTLRLRESGFLTDEHRQENVGGWKKELGDLEEFLGRDR
jgi:uncharacterized protein YndB with AHSA1/START domain